MGPQSREVLTMDGSEAGTVSFGRKNGCFVSNSCIGFSLLVFLTALVATGLLVYFFAGQPNTDQSVEYSYIQSSNSKNEIVDSTTKDAHRKMKSLMPKKKIDVRLPLHLKPLHYLVRLIPFISGNFSIHGYLEFTFEVLKPSNNITLHIKDIITKNETVKVYPADNMASQMKVVSQKYDTERQFYVATLMRNLKVGEKYVITMDYIGYLNSDLVGFYRSSYKDEFGNTKWLAATQMQPTDARKAFPCMDEPALKANFTIQIARQNNMSAISNMPLERSEPMADPPGWTLDYFLPSVPMPTYLVAFAVSDFGYLESTNASYKFKFRVYARKSALSQAEYALKVGPPMTAFFENFFNIPFPLPKQDMIALPDFSAGAMENWGLITYRETAMLYDPAISKASDKFWIGVVVSHELAHQWFGNLVTMKWWTDLWLNEGFASYMEYLGLDAVEPTYKVQEQFVVTDLQSVFRLDCLESSHPISIPVKHPDEINEIFDRISYSKGASIIRMMSYFLTESTFRKGLTNYLNAFAYGNAEQDDLWRFLTKQAHMDKTLPQNMAVKQIMDTWTLQMGFPVITVKRKPNGMAMLTQERFLLIKNPNSTDTHDYKWWVPITFATKSKPDFSATKPSIWMSPTEAQKTIKGIPSTGWFILNVQETGYYRVNYEQDNWNAISTALKTKHTDIGEVNRAQLIDDSLSLSRAGLLKYETSLSILSYLASENDYVPWRAALSNLGFIRNMFSQKGGYGPLKAFLTAMLVPVYNKVGFVDRVSDPYLEKRKRASILSWMCSLEYKPCVDESVKLFKMWMKNPDNYTIISPNLKPFVYCTAISQGAEPEWQFAWNRYENANVGSEKKTLLYALGCSKKPWILSDFLDRALSQNRGIRKQDTRTVISAVSSNKIGRYIAWEFFKDKWEQILEYFGPVSFTLGGIVKSVTSNLNRRNELKELILFRDTYIEKSKSAKRAIEQSVENTKNNVEWMEKNYDIIHQWLSDNGYKSPI